MIKTEHSRTLRAVGGPKAGESMITARTSNGWENIAVDGGHYWPVPPHDPRMMQWHPSNPMRQPVTDRTLRHRRERYDKAVSLRQRVLDDAGMDATTKREVVQMIDGVIGSNIREIRRIEKSAERTEVKREIAAMRKEKAELCKKVT